MLSRLAIISRSSTTAVRLCSVRAASTATRMSLSAADAQLRPDQVREVLRSMAVDDDEKHNELVYSLSYAEEDHVDDVEAWKFSVLTDPCLQAQIKHSKNQLKKLQANPRNQDVAADTTPLPKILEEALRPSRRAIVVTETKAPFRIVDVNSAWSDLCGYSFVESQGKSLGSLLKGPETDQVAATGLISKLLQGEEAGTVLINYAKNGRRFQNRVRVGPLYGAQGEVTHFVGVLQEM